MSRKDYVALAAALNEAKAETSEILGSAHVLKIASERIASALKEENIRFDRARFMSAAGFEDEGRRS